MSGCITCGCPTGRRQCKECALLERVDEEIAAEKEKEDTTDDDDSEATGVTLGPVAGCGTQKSYHTNCENCSEAIPAAARFCPDCGTEQTRAVESIQRIRSETEVRTDGGPDADVSESGDAVPRGQEQQDRYHLCVTCGRLKHEDLFEIGDCTCEDCYNADDNKIRYREADDGDGFVAVATKQNQPTDADSDEENDD